MFTNSNNFKYIYVLIDYVLKAILMIIQSRRKAVILNGPMKFLKIKILIYIHILLKRIWQVDQ